MASLSIIFEDNHLLCLDKPGGLLTQPSGTTQDSLEAQAKAYLKEKYQKPGAVFLEAVHRIDRPVCGVVLFARTSKALSRLNEAMRAGECEKEYRAVVSGIPRARKGTLRNFLVHDEHFARVVPSGTPGAKEAVLSYVVLEERGAGQAFLKILLGSGRYHQIRAQLSHAGHPIVGDARYGSAVSYRAGCIALQNWRLSIRHPVTHEQLSFTALHNL